MEFIYGDVDTILHADINNLKLELYDGTVAADITDNVDTDTAPVGTVFAKTKTLSEAMAIIKSDQGRLNKDSV